MREPWHVLPRHLLPCQPGQGQPAGPYLATRAGAKRLSHERTRPPEACENLWPYCSVNDSNIYGSVPVTWTHATWWHLLLQFLSNTNIRCSITPQSILETTRCFGDLSGESYYLQLLPFFVILFFCVALLWCLFLQENENMWEICHFSFSQLWYEYIYTYIYTCTHIDR